MCECEENRDRGGEKEKKMGEKKKRGEDKRKGKKGK